MRKLLLFLFVIVLANCGPTENVYFDQAQPVSINETKHFQRRIKGQYQNCFDSNDHLTITDNSIIHTTYWYSKFHINELEKDSKNNTPINPKEELHKMAKKAKVKLAIEGDSISVWQENKDTIFYPSKSQVLKKFKRSYFLNTQTISGFWKVHRLTLKKDTLFLGQISPSDSLMQYNYSQKKVEKNDSGRVQSIEYILQPNKKQFKKLLKPNSFTSSQCYCKTP